MVIIPIFILPLPSQIFSPLTSPVSHSNLFGVYKPKYDPIASKQALPHDAPEIAETTVIPNPTSGVTIIRCTAVTVPEATAEVVDAQGNIVIKRSATTTKEHTLEFEIDAKALTTGSYQYRITSGQQHVAAGSFAVVK